MTHDSHSSIKTCDIVDWIVKGIFKGKDIKVIISEYYYHGHNTTQRLMTELGAYNDIYYIYISTSGIAITIFTTSLFNAQVS